MVAVQGFNDRDKLNLCLLYRYIISYEPYNFKGRPEDYPLTLEYGKKIDALRRKYAEYLWHTECRDTIGASVTSDGKSHSLYSVFVNPESGKRAIAIANQDPKKKIQASVQVEGKCGNFMIVTPEKPEPTPFKSEVAIPPRSAAVLLEQ
jgi:hypothetical protein